MISIVAVYNDDNLLNRILIPSIKNQTAKHELILIDNTGGKFKSAAAAFNFGAKQANGEYIMFVHQDVELDLPSWLETAENLVRNIPDLGIAGVAGMSEGGKDDKERGRGYFSYCGEIWQYSNAVQASEQVQTLEECLLIIPRAVFNKLQFDEIIFDSWHCYGTDYCLSIAQLGLKSYVIPKFIYHRSLRHHVKDLLKYQKRLYNKHKASYKVIYTTGGEVSWLKLNWYSITKLLQPLQKRLFPSFGELLKNPLSHCDTVLDLGCGYNSPIQYYDVPFSVGVEFFEPYLQESSKKGIHNQYIKADIMKVEFMPKSFDAVIAIEVLEHLTKEEGTELLGKMEQWSRKKIIITTPNGYLWQDDYDNNPMQQHKSGWSAEELQKLGFKVYGMEGWKKLKGYRGEVRYKPVFLYNRISELTQTITYRLPKFAFQILAVKTIKDEQGNGVS